MEVISSVVNYGNEKVPPSKLRRDAIVGSALVLHDGSLGTRQDFPTGWIIIEEGTIDRLIIAAKRVTSSTSAGLRRLFLIIAGGYESSPNALGINPQSWHSLRRSILPDMSRIYIRKIRSFITEVEAEGGRVIVSTLIPRPIDVDPDVSPNSTSLQRYMSDIFVKFNNSIRVLNGPITTPNINGTLEAKSRNNKRGEAKIGNMYFGYHDERSVRDQKKSDSTFMKLISFT